MATRISANDLTLACEFIFKSTSVGKWNKPHWQAAAMAMAWFIRELPGSPVLLNRVLRLMESHTDAAVAMSEATNLIRAQSLDASILSAVPPVPSTSTQAHPGTGRSLEEVLEEDLEDLGLDASPIPSGQPAATASSLEGNDDDGAADTAKPGRTIPVALAAAPAATTSVRVPPAPAAIGGGVAAACGVAVANKRKVAPVHKTPPDVHKTPVCPYLWKRMLCRRPNCQFRHPDLCAASSCVPSRAPDCNRFHGRYKEERDGNQTIMVKKNKKAAAAANKSSKKPAQGNVRRGGPPHNRSSSGRANNRRFPPSSAPRRESGAAPAGGGNLQEMQRELETTIRRLNAATTSPLGYSYADAVRSSARAQPKSFAAVFATALESALETAGLRLTSAC